MIQLLDAHQQQRGQDERKEALPHQGETTYHGRWPLIRSSCRTIQMSFSCDLPLSGCDDLSNRQTERHLFIIINFGVSRVLPQLTMRSTKNQHCGWRIEIHCKDDSVSIRSSICLSRFSRVSDERRLSNI